MGNQISNNQIYVKKHLEDTSFNLDGSKSNRKLACQNGLVSMNRKPLLTESEPQRMIERIGVAQKLCAKEGYQMAQIFGGGYVIAATSDDTPCKMNEHLGVNLGYCNDFGLAKGQLECNTNSVSQKLMY